ncbi:MAG: hypothetical protein BM556_12155 [Bacteriovorax sp. MedPE-SWde]|nr:MAG: hypothetical protein BM556_12155 [Bacteriovorax sp. MedPE-SWde]
MARLRLNIPDKEEVYTTEIPLLVNFINYGGHMGNDSVLTLCHEARIRYLESLGQSELDLFGPGIIQVDSLIIYKSEGHRGDLIELKLYIDDISDYGFDLIYHLINKTTGKELARAKTGIVFFDYSVKKMVKIPIGFGKLH